MFRGECGWVNFELFVRIPHKDDGNGDGDQGDQSPVDRSNIPDTRKYSNWYEKTGGVAKGGGTGVIECQSKIRPYEALPPEKRARNEDY